LGACQWSIRIKNQTTKIAFDFCVVLIGMTLVNFLFMLITGDTVNWGGTVFNSVLIWLGVEFYTLSVQKRKALMRETLLEREFNMQKYELMQAYVNPHFLFNSLDILCSMVEQDEKEESIEFIEHLASFYRRMMRRRKIRKIALEDELSSMKDYLAVVSHHYGPVLKVNVMDEDLKGAYCVPFSLQLLIENALKHNVISKETPMTINIGIRKDGITVSNPLTPKPEARSKSSGMGLSYLKNMYAEFGHTIKIVNNQNFFSVTLPSTI
ncbi:MAG: histidine kinase, partial [Muribaculaceae bacterium]|nr:histidine kinase [Muribaculaceae bacterium]